MKASLSIVAVLFMVIIISGCTTTYKTVALLPLQLPPLPPGCGVAPVSFDIELPESFRQVPLAEILVTLAEDGPGRAEVPGQLVRNGDGTVSLWWMAHCAKEGGSGKWTAVLSATSPAREQESDTAANSFAWKAAPGQHIDLLFKGTKKLRYMCGFDPSSEERLHETYKPYYHVFDADGEKLLTKGPGGLYTHHRGIFLGWNRVTLQGKEYDFWHMKGVVQRHMEVLDAQAGPVLAMLKTRIHWELGKDIPVIVEDREIMVFQQERPDLLLLDFHSSLTAVQGDLFLNGDPEHAGFQYRPHNDVADGKDDPDIRARYLFHDKGIDPRKDKDLPWVGLTYGLNGKQYTVQHMNAASDPKGTLYSAYRDYGRFGAFSTPTIKHGETLVLRYRIYVREGDRANREAMAGRYDLFNNAPVVELSSTKPSSKKSR